MTDLLTHDREGNISHENLNSLLYTKTYTYASGKDSTVTTAADGTLTADIITYYDKYGNVTKTEEKSEDNILTTSYEYDYQDRQTKTTNPNGNSTTYEYDCKGQLVKQTNPDNTTLLTQYDLAGQVISATDANGSTQISKYSYNYKRFRYCQYYYGCCNRWRNYYIAKRTGELYCRVYIGRDI